MGAKTDEGPRELADRFNLSPSPVRTTSRSKPLTGPTRDSQRQKVYDWGRPYEKFDRLTLPECEQLIIWAHAQYGIVWRGKLADGRGRRSAGGQMSLITLPVWSRTSVVVLHEAAHAISQWKFGRRAIAPHGPEFFRILLELVVRRKVVPMTEARARARAAKINVSVNPLCIPIPALKLKRLDVLKARHKELKAELAAVEAELSEIRNEKVALSA